jgi:mono/diheme cytochrome c family protein
MAGVATTAAGTIDAAALYAEDCASCHKDIPGGNLDKIKAVIKSGEETMPGFADKLSAEQITALATWVAAGGK